MDTRIIIFLLFSLSITVQPTWGHLCLIFPEQRGAMDITVSGSSTCFRHGAECGGQPPQTPGVTPYIGGSQMWIKIQQNYNHYEVGYPGYMDLAIAPINSTDFMTLAFTTDYYVYAQDHQQNFTTIVVVPNIDCPHCVLRARYNAHKPGETIFYQCADIKIQKSDSINMGPIRSLPPLSQSFDPEYRNLKKKFDMLRYKHRNGPQISVPYLVGFSFNPFQKSIVDLVNISVETGYPYHVHQYDMNIETSIKGIEKQRVDNHRERQPETEKYMYDGIGGINSMGNVVGLLHTGTPDEIIDVFVEFDLNQQGKIMHSSVLTDTGGPINAIMPYETDRYYTFSILPGTKQGDYVFVLGMLLKQSIDQVVYTPILKSMPENLYINFQWAEYDPGRNMIYVLMGNENAADKLQARFYIFNPPNMTITHTEIDVSEYTFMSMHFDIQSGKMFAVSPGLHLRTYTQWHLIEVDPFTGKSQHVLQIVNFGYFARYYGGSIFNSVSHQGVLYHVFRLYDTNADVIVAIDLTKKTLTFSEITNIRDVHNIGLITRF